MIYLITCMDKHFYFHLKLKHVEEVCVYKFLI